MRLRDATPADIAAMVQIEQASPEAARWTPALYSALFSKGPPLRIVLVAEEAGQVCGFITGRVLGGECELEQVVVAPLSRRQGVGRELVQALVERAAAAGATSVLLEVRESNQAARMLYQRCNFTESGRRRAYYQSPDEDAIVYSLLNPPGALEIG